MPEHVEWFIAEQIQQFRVDGQETGLVWINSILVRADSAERAYDRANELGMQSEQEYANPDGRKVQVTFAGLRDLFPVYDRLEDGAELFYESKENLTNDQIRALAKQKQELAIFAIDQELSNGDK